MVVIVSKAKRIGVKTMKKNWGGQSIVEGVIKTHLYALSIGKIIQNFCLIFACKTALRARPVGR